jgi:hypothetical protein
MMEQITSTAVLPMVTTTRAAAATIVDAANSKTRTGPAFSAHRSHEFLARVLTYTMIALPGGRAVAVGGAGHGSSNVMRERYE